MKVNLSLQTYRAIIAYDGTAFAGFQVQATDRTVQGTLEAALQKITNASPRVIGAGRTDAGVHATGQVIAFRIGWNHSLTALQAALNANLPADVVVVEVALTEPAFHPRYHALSRQYGYTVLNQPMPDVLRRYYVAHIPRPLELPAMQTAAAYLMGRHDFASFGQPPQGTNTVRTVTQAEWQATGPELRFEITANAFLYKMVRTIVGVLLEVGVGKLPPAEILRLLQVKDRTQVKVLAPPRGLCLIQVTY